MGIFILLMEVIKKLIGLSVGGGARAQRQYSVVGDS